MLVHFSEGESRIIFFSLVFFFELVFVPVAHRGFHSFGIMGRYVALLITGVPFVLL